MEQDLLVQLLQMLLGKLGVMPQATVWLLSVQTFNKLMQKIYPLIKEYVKGSESKADDKILEEAEASKLGLTVKFLADLLLRIKL